MSDKIFFQSENLLVTNTRFQVDNETYIIRNITSVRVNVTPGKKGTPATKFNKNELLIINFFAILICIFLGVLTTRFLIGWFFILLGLIIVFDENFIKNTPGTPDEPDTHELILKTAGGEIKAFVSQDKILMNNLVKALNQAFDYGG